MNETELSVNPQLKIKTTVRTISYQIDASAYFWGYFPFFHSWTRVSLFFHEPRSIPWLGVIPSVSYSFTTR